MRLKLLIVAGFAAALSISAAKPLFTSRAAAQSNGQKLPAGKITLPSNDEKWGPMVDKYDHQQHLAFSTCTYCHHTNKNLTLESFNAGKADKIQNCKECHTQKEDDPKNSKKADGTQVWSKEAYHVNCIDCHKGEVTRFPKDVGPAAIKKQGEGPTKCAECHEKKE